MVFLCSYDLLFLWQSFVATMFINISSSQHSATYNSSLPLISVVTVCRNNCEGLLITMKNIAMQNYPRIEYIVVDGGSNDGTTLLLANYSGLLSKWVSEPDKGIYDAMNKAASMATGQWVIFMNAGDTFAMPNVLSRIFTVPRYGDIIYGDVIRNGHVKIAEPPHNSHRMYFCHQSSLISRECLLRFPFDTNYSLSADFKQMKQLYLSKHQFVQLHFPIACYDTNGISNIHRSHGLKDNIRIVRETDKWIDKLRLLPRLFFVYYLCRLRGK